MIDKYKSLNSCSIINLFPKEFLRIVTVRLPLLLSTIKIFVQVKSLVGELWLPQSARKRTFKHGLSFTKYPVLKRNGDLQLRISTWFRAYNSY